MLNSPRRSVWLTPRLDPLQPQPRYLAGFLRQHIITTRTYQERLDTLEKVREAGIKKLCSGGIVGLGETVTDRGLLLQLANLPTPPEACQSAHAGEGKRHTPCG